MERNRPERLFLSSALESRYRSRVFDRNQWGFCSNVIDPSAGSPTETLLRLLLPLSDKVH